MPTTDADFLARALSLATANVADNGGPFGAVIVSADGQVFDGVNRVTAANDPTAHAEVSAIRNACAALETFNLSGAILYTSCEPCPMCLAASLWARVERVVFAANRHDAAGAGFDDAAFYEFFEVPARRGMLPVEQLSIDEGQAMAPFNAWNAADHRTDY